MPVTCLRVSEYSSAEEEKGPSEMKSLLFALGIALCCFVQAEWKEVTKTSIEDLGRWVILAVAGNSLDNVEQIRNMSALVVDLSRPQEDMFSVSVFLPTPDGCKNVTCQLRKEENGKYHSLSDNTTVTVKSVKILDGFIMTTLENDNTTASTLLSRTPTPNPEIIQKFKEECKKLGYSEAQIAVLKPTVKCQ
ncbi:extracellular fatty acid-binding protein-like [Pituophis catenifer annectens]|uniref:extracellular fatty acid-binding protein-like n=1 Tax=Pituophis catenifer annectens TaxID=94852 RepID=UPI003991B4C9